jgi:thiamine-monophosphate kinase
VPASNKREPYLSVELAARRRDSSMKLSKLGEFGLIERIRRAIPKGSGVHLGIGDDAAWVENKSPSGLITSDLLIEGVHFDRRWTSLYALGYKVLAVNLSDIAAMGGLPAYVILSVGIPSSFRSEEVLEIYRGIRSLASKTGVSIIGGDTSAAEKLFISTCLIGHAPVRPVLRSGAKVGHDLYVTGTLGDSALALKLLKKNPKGHPGTYLLSRHNRPVPRLRAGALLARRRLATAMIDVSDGLVQDLGHMCELSGVGAIVYEERLPLSRAYRALTRDDGTSHALTGGEDYELLFCARRQDRARLQQLESALDVPITWIGECVPARQGIKVLDSRRKPIPIRTKGHDHFKH